MANLVRVLIVEDNTVVRQLLKMALEQDSSLEIVGEAADGQAALDMALALKPQVILMDIGLPVIDGIEATRQIKASFPEARVLMVTSHTNCEEFMKALSAGADGYCLKESVGEQLAMAIKCVCADEVWIDQAMAKCKESV